LEGISCIQFAPVERFEETNTSIASSFSRFIFVDSFIHSQYSCCKVDYFSVFNLI